MNIQWSLFCALSIDELNIKQLILSCIWAKWKAFSRVMGLEGVIYNMVYCFYRHFAIVNFLFLFVYIYFLFILQTHHSSLSHPSSHSLTPLPKPLLSTQNVGVKRPGTFSWGRNKSLLLHQCWARHPALRNGLQRDSSYTRDRLISNIINRSKY